MLLRGTLVKRAWKQDLAETPYIYRKKIGPYWVLCEKYTWPEVWKPSTDSKSYQIVIDGEEFEFSHELHKYMRNMHTVEDLIKPEKKKKETPEEFYELKDEMTEDLVHASSLVPAILDLPKVAYSEATLVAKFKAAPHQVRAALKTLVDLNKFVSKKSRFGLAYYRKAETQQENWWNLLRAKVGAAPCILFEVHLESLKSLGQEKQFATFAEFEAYFEEFFNEAANQ